MSLLDHAIWWHVYPLGATGAPLRDHAPDQVKHRLSRLEPWLDHAVELGCSGVLLGPVFASTSHGYDTLDHFRLDPRLGDDADWDDFVEQAHGRGLAIMLDGVFNHVGAGHELVEKARSGEADDGGGSMIRLVDGRPADWEGHGDLAELDHADPRVADLVESIMLHWLRRGADGWRLDVAYAVPSEFWARVLGRVRAEFPDAMFLGEVIHGDYAEIAAAGTLDSVTQYELWKAIWSSLADRNMWELAAALERHDAFSTQTMMQTFVGNHDVTRIATRVGDEGAALAAVVLLTLPGMPSIYYGDEQGFRGDKGEGFATDDALRPALPDSPADLAPEGWWLHRLYQALISVRRRNPGSPAAR
ncbi:alpha-amylase family protein [Mobilicoccus caccae]|uniref:Cyclomaltodextrinase n=1 Tax=Mobilicoccus caccae TaxID=1859295 RepID=A0ABQ6ISQ1_9MICO|nr:alpha-amylase family protein [Mobilicoccus caccae]GMA40395.1 cyclomaltodextrinase [Mobilicoccus caccae]